MTNNLVKIPVLGIQNAGKSSLIKTLQREFKQLPKLKPTKGIERIKIGFLDKDVMIWDCGGQEKYRESYLKKAELTFGDVEEIFYVVDITDQDSFLSSFNFFQEIVSELKKNTPKPTINLLINKLDPGSEMDADLVKLYQALGERYSQIAAPLNLRINQTSIFNPLSVVRAFSKPLFGNATLYDNFSMLFMEFANENQVGFIIVLSKEFLEIGNYFSSTVNQSAMKGIAEKLIHLFENKGMKIDDLLIEDGPFQIKVIRFEAGGKEFYFTVGFDPKNFEDLNVIIANIYNLFADVKKIMKYF